MNKLIIAIALTIMLSGTAYAGEYNHYYEPEVIEGPQGPAGADGQNGVNGQDGKDGVNASKQWENTFGAKVDFPHLVRLSENGYVGAEGVAERQTDLFNDSNDVRVGGYVKYTNYWGFDARRK